jgi:PAS domain-containing protein
MALIGWALRIDALQRVDPALPPMVPNTALMVALLAAAISLDAAGSCLARRTRALACGAVLLLAGATLAQYLLGVDLGIDGLLSAGASEGAGRFPGRPSPQSALALALLAGAVLAARSRSRWAPRVAPALAWAAAATVTAALLGYLLGAQYVYDSSTAFRMGVPSLASLALLSIAVFCLSPDAAPASWYVEQTRGAAVARQIMPRALLLPVLAATIAARGAEGGAWSDEVGLGLLALAALGVIQAIVAGGVTAANRGQALREALERESRAERRRFTTLTSRAPFGIFETDAAGTTTYANEALLEIVAANPDGDLHAAIVDAVHPDDRERVLLQWRDGAARGQDFTGEYRVLRPTGELRRHAPHPADRR